MMPSYEFDIGEQAQVGSRFISDVRDELQRALATEKAARKITQQQIADALGTSRAVINRQIIGQENIGLRRVAEILWAIGWEPHFEVRKVPIGENQYPQMMPTQSESPFAQIKSGSASTAKASDKIYLIKPILEPAS